MGLKTDASVDKVCFASQAKRNKSQISESDYGFHIAASRDLTTFASTVFGASQSEVL